MARKKKTGRREEKEEEFLEIEEGVPSNFNRSDFSISNVSRTAQKKEKVFWNYLYLPPEVRMVIVDEMEPADRCRFSGCSISSNKEAKSSKNYVYGLEFSSYHSKTYIKVKHGKIYGYELQFWPGSEERFIFHMECKTLDGRKVWVTELYKFIEPHQYATDHFRQLLKLHQKTIKDLEVKCDYSIYNFKNVDSQLVSLRNLQHLTVGQHFDIQRFLSLIHRPLKTVSSSGEENNRNLANSEQMYQADRVIAHRAKLNKEQFLRLKASNVSIHIGELTEKDIFDFIRSWQRGSIRKNVRRYEWYISGSNFNGPRLLRLFGEPYSTLAGRQTIYIDSDCGNWKFAELTYYKLDQRHDLLDKLGFEVKD